MTELVVVRFQTSIAGSVFIARLAICSQAVSFFQDRIKILTYAPHMTCSSGNTVKKYNRRGKISIAVRIKATVNVVAFNAKNLTRSL